MATRVLAVLCAMTAPTVAAAFGTVDGFGQQAEHAKITTWALQGVGFGPATLRDLVGHGGLSFGAVGAPDNPARGLLDDKPAHCDGGDYLDAPGYRQSKDDARGHLEACRDWIFSELHLAVADAASLAQPTRPPAQARPCRFNGKRTGSAKCLVLEDLGLALHASQDFYSHTNWVDVAAPGAIAASNPPGLGHTGPAPWLDPEAGAAFPDGLISGCYDGFPEVLHCAHGRERPRVAHAVLNKDNGTIDLGAHTAGAGTTPRGAIDDNFRRAVEAAVEDTRSKWLYFERQVLESYGRGGGALALCRIKSDGPMSCGEP